MVTDYFCSLFCICWQRFMHHYRERGISLPDAAGSIYQSCGWLNCCRLQQRRRVTARLNSDGTRTRFIYGAQLFILYGTASDGMQFATPGDDDIHRMIGRTVRSSVGGIRSRNGRRNTQAVSTFQGKHQAPESGRSKLNKLDYTCFS